MKMKEEKEYADNYEIIQSCKIGRRRIVLGEDLKSENPYFIATATPWLAGWRYDECYISADYLEICREFVNRQQVELENLQKERAERNSDGIPYGQEVCVEESYKQNYTNRILVLKTEYLAPQFRVKEEQLVLAQSGFGCLPNARGTKVYCRDCWTGERFYVTRNDVMGIMKPESVPQWAMENVALFREEINEKREVRQER